jgi:hypothetical protein
MVRVVEEVAMAGIIPHHTPRCETHSKLGGVARLPAGDAARAAERLRTNLAGLGLFLVPVGELERWVTVEGGHGPEWVSRVLEGNRHLPLRPDLAEFGRHVLGYLSNPAATPEP